MSKVFGKESSPSNKPPRNTDDLSFQNNLTFNLGGLYPVLCKEVLPGDSVRIDTAFGLRFLPLYFPVQTKMRAYLHYFYVRSRNLWDDFKDWFGNTKPNLVRPYIAGTPQQYAMMLRTSGLGDYLNVPTTVITDSTETFPLTASALSEPCYYGSGPTRVAYSPRLSENKVELVGNPTIEVIEDSAFCPVSQDDATESLYGSFYLINQTISINGVPVRKLGAGDSLTLYIPKSWSGYVAGICVGSQLQPQPAISTSYKIVNDSWVDAPEVTQASVPWIKTTFTIPSDFVPFGDNLRIAFFTNIAKNILLNFGGSGQALPNLLYSTSSLKEVYDINDIKLTPYGTNGAGDGVHLLAEPFRAYEQIYNAFYRDERNNPFILNNQPEYQKFLPTTAGGYDETVYSIRYRNWEQDPYTTAVPSPQQGNAPLVGITDAGVATFVDPETENPVRVQLLSSDAKDGSIGEIRYIDQINPSVARSLVNVVTSGISINDFRNVNSYQRWLETNIRKGYKYQDQIEGHYGVNVSYTTLDMPEFIGGVVKDVDVTQINQTVESEGNPLGSYAGQAYAIGSAKHRVHKYFDEPGYLIGILCVVPQANYSQILPKMFTKYNRLDIFTPEFGKIGYQPILNSELCPVQTYVNNPENLSKVFGYQRPWYDYLASVDEVHGAFRTSLRDFLINRVFSSTPTLGPDFTVMNPDQLNNIFSVQEESDKIIGQVHFDLKFKRPIPLSGVASLE